MKREQRILEELINEIKRACPLFLKTSTYLRQRRDCPSTKHFNEGITIIDKAVARAMEELDYIQKEQP